MKLPKTNKSRMFTWLILEIFGYLINLLLIKPMLYGWGRSLVFTDNLFDGLRQLSIVEIFMLPALFAVLFALFQSIKDKKFTWTAIHLAGLLVLLLLIMYFALPIVSPPRGL